MITERRERGRRARRLSLQPNPATAGFVGLRFLFHIHFSWYGFGFWAAVVLAVALVATAVRARDTAQMTPTPA
jgi:hypothetical protein